MADIVFRYEAMQSTVQQINDIAERYTSAANKLNNDFESAVSAWEGDSKDKLISFMGGPVLEYTGNKIPEMIKGLAELLQQNIKTMQEADQQIAENIPQSLG